MACAVLLAQGHRLIAAVWMLQARAQRRRDCECHGHAPWPQSARPQRQPLLHQPRLHRRPPRRGPGGALSWLNVHPSQARARPGPWLCDGPWTSALDGQGGSRGGRAVWRVDSDDRFRHLYTDLYTLNWMFCASLARRLVRCITPSALVAEVNSGYVARVGCEPRVETTNDTCRAARRA